MNVHELLDVGTVRLSALLAGDAPFFARSVDSPPLVEVARDAAVDVDDVSSAGRHDVAVRTPIGEFEAAYRPWRWLGSEYPTLVYHHGSGERPFDLGRWNTNSFRRLFVGHEAAVPANVVAVRAPFHDRPAAGYLRAMGDLRNFVGMLAASVGLFEALVDRVHDRTDAPVILAGISLGGWASTLHRTCFDSADCYVPVFAGAALDELFVSSSYRYLTAPSAVRNPDRLRRALDFEAAFRAVEADDCRPLLARYDRIVEFDRQRPSYRGMRLTVLDRGHVTGALATGALRDHLVGAIEALDAPGKATEARD